MQRIISYMSYLENSIKTLCGQLNVKPNHRWTVLTSSLKDIEKAGNLYLRDSGNICLLTLVLSAAFDTVDYDILLERLKSYFNIRGSILSWFLPTPTSKGGWAKKNAKLKIFMDSSLSLLHPSIHPHTQLHKGSGHLMNPMILY